MTDYALGVQLCLVTINGWEAVELTDVWPNGQPRPIAFLDEEALQRLHDQSGQAIDRLRQRREDA